MNVYFDNAATTPIRAEVVDEIRNCMLETYGNPSSTHSFGRSAKAKLENARKIIASYLNASSKEIIFTSGGTESDNMLIRCAVKDLGVRTIISSKLEHHAVLHTLDELEKNGIKIKYVETNIKGQINYSDLENKLNENDSKKLVTLMYINNEIGNILDLERVGALCKQYQAFFHTDAVQGVAHFNIDVKKCNIDFLSAAAHKFHGPKGVGFSYVNNNCGINPFIFGGSQERGLRAGTEALPNIIGMEKAMTISYNNINQEKEYILSLKSYFIESITKIFPNIHFNGYSSNLTQSTYTLVNVSLPIIKEKASLLDFQLDLKGIACSKGSACQSGSNKGSHVLEQLQSNSINEWPSLRFSFSKFNTREEIDYVIKVLKEFIE